MNFPSSRTLLFILGTAGTTFALNACSGGSSGGSPSFPQAASQAASTSTTSAGAPELNVGAVAAGQSSSPITVQARSAAAPMATPKPTAVALSTERPAMAEALVDAVGVDTHFDERTTPYVTEWSRVGPELIASGIRHIRDGQFEGASYGTILTTLGQHGIDHSIGFEVNVTAAQVKEALEEQAPYVDFVEPANEYDLESGQDPQWAAHINAETKLLYATVHGDSNFAKVSVLGPALAHQSWYSQLGDETSFTDAGNLHDTTCNSNPGTSRDYGIAAFEALVKTSTAKPVWTTETGYDDSVSRPCSLPDDIIAKYDPRTVAERFIAGEPRTYFYQFVDMPTDAMFGYMGLLRSTGEPKPQYTSLSSMIAFLKDDGPPFTPAALTYALTGNTTNVHHLLLQRSDGTYVLMLWLEVPCWKSIHPNNIGGTRVTVNPQPVTITLSTPRSADLYQYRSNWSLGQSTLGASKASYTLSVDDQIEFVTLK